MMQPRGYHSDMSRQKHIKKITTTVMQYTEGNSGSEAITVDENSHRQK